MLDQQVLEEIYTIAEKVGAHQVLTEREQAMYDDILEDAGYYQVFCLYTAMIDFPTFYEQSVSGEVAICTLTRVHGRFWGSSSRAKAYRGAKYS